MRMPIGTLSLRYSIPNKKRPSLRGERASEVFLIQYLHLDTSL